MSEYEELKRQIDDMENNNKKQAILEKFMLTEDAKSLPLDLVKKLIDPDEAITNANIELLKGTLNIKKLAENSARITELQNKIDAATKNGNTALVVSLKNKIFEEQSKK
jgi:hypothetical protein